MDFVNILQSFGFPIFCTVVLGAYVVKRDNQNREDRKEENRLHKEEIQELNKQHNEEMRAFKDEIKEAINNNTNALNLLKESLQNLSNK